MSMGRSIEKSLVPNEWLDCGDCEDLDVTYATTLEDSLETLSETAVAGLVDHVDNDVEKAFNPWEVEQDEDKESFHQLKEAPQSANLLYDPNAIVNSFEEPSVSTMDSKASTTVDSLSAEASDLDFPYKVIVFRGRHILMKLPKAPNTPDASITSEQSDDVEDASSVEQCEKGAQDPSGMRVVGIADDDIQSYVTSTTKSVTIRSPPPSPASSPPRSSPPTNNQYSGNNNSHADSTPRATAVSPQLPPEDASDCCGHVKTCLPDMLDCVLLVSLCISFSVILFLAILFTLYILEP